MVGDELYFFEVDYSVELDGDLLGVGAEPARVPPFRPVEKEGGDGVVLFFGAAGDDLEFKFATH